MDPAAVIHADPTWAHPGQQRLRVGRKKKNSTKWQTIICSTATNKKENELGIGGWSTEHLEAAWLWCGGDVVVRQTGVTECRGSTTPQWGVACPTEEVVLVSKPAVSQTLLF